ncbi:MAG: cytochrome c [Holophagaceae bacterium]|nr:cytochrome c [Holophagaceae bacterium]
MRVSLLLLLPACLSAGDAPKSVNELKAFFAANCVRCHGVDGSARGADGKKLSGQDFTDARDMAHKKDVKLAQTIRKGIFFGKVMPAFKEQLSEADATALVAEIVRKAEKGKAIAPAPDAGK